MRIDDRACARARVESIMRPWAPIIGLAGLPVRPTIGRERSCICHTCITRTTRASPSPPRPSEYLPGVTSSLDRVRPPLDGGQVVFDSDTFRGSLHAGRACCIRPLRARPGDRPTVKILTYDRYVSGFRKPHAPACTKCESRDRELRHEARNPRAIIEARIRDFATYVRLEYA